MKANRRIYAAGAILLVFAGCVVPEYFKLNYFQGGDSGNDRVVAASIDIVAQAAQLGLRGVGMKVEVTPQGQDIRLVAGNSFGDELSVLLSRVVDEKGERTRVRIEAGSKEQTQILFGILARFEPEQRR
jgi:hypothetical protein